MTSTKTSRLVQAAAIALAAVLAIALPGPAWALAGPGEVVAAASFGEESASGDVRRVADWVMASADNRGLPFVILDKVNAKVFVFDSRGGLLGASAALLGMARGDDGVPGVGERKLSSIRPAERITPAGRFVAAKGRDFDGADIVWVDYDAGIAMHRVITTNPREHRLQRLATATPLDNRISFGCINLPAEFYDRVVSPAFTGTDGVVYILPEVRSVESVFFHPAFAVGPSTPGPAAIAR